MKLRLNQLEPNRWNANEVTGDKYLLLVKDMREAGQREPITVSPHPIFYNDPKTWQERLAQGYTGPTTWKGLYVICDGEHRYKAAVELGWAELEATVEELTEDQAVTRFYRQQATRGGFDPLREARMFQHYLDDGLTQEQVVDKLGLTNRAYLTDRIMLLKLSPLVQDLVANLKGMIAASIKEKATNETEEELKTLTEDIVERSTITMMHLRPISTLPENDQGLLVSALIGTFAEGGTVSTRQVEALVRDVKQRNEKLESFNAAWETAKVRVCPLCGRPPLLGNWQLPGRDPRTFACVLGHMWRYDVTAEEAHEEERKAREAREEEQRRRLEEATRARKAEDAKTLDGILADYAEPPTLPDLMREFYSMSSYIDYGDVKRAVALYLEEHPGVKLTEPLTPEQQEEKRRQEAEARRIYVEAKMEDDEHILARIAALYRDELTRKRLLDDYLELSRTIVPQDGRDVIALYLERHPEVTFPGDEPDDTDSEISEALGQPPVPKERGGFEERGDISKVLFGKELEDVESDEDEEGPEEPLSLLIPLTAAELHSRLVPWILGKVEELSDVKSIRIEGLRDREEVRLEYAEPDAKGRTEFNFSVQTTSPGLSEGIRHVETWDWTGFKTRKTAKGLEVTSGKLSSAEEKDLTEIRRFLDETVYKDLDPWDDPDTLTGPLGFTLTPVDSKGGEPTPPVPDLDAGEEYHEHYERDIAAEDPAIVLCPKCGKLSPNENHCISCGHLFKQPPQEE